MPRSPRDSHDRPPYRRISWRDVLAAYVLAAAIPLALWAASAPLAAGSGLAVSGVGVLGARRARRLARCVRDCRGLELDLPGTVSVTVTWRQDCCPA